MEESIPGEGTNLNKIIERKGNHGLYGSEGTCLVVVEILCWGRVLKGIDEGHHLNALISYLSLGKVRWEQSFGIKPLTYGI